MSRPDPEEAELAVDPLKGLYGPEVRVDPVAQIGRLSNTHRCPAPDCPKVISKSLFACKPHWFSLSKPVRDAIWATAGTFSRERIDAVKAAMEELHGG